MKQKVIVTIDTEGHQGENPIDKLIFGNTRDGIYGIEKIMDEFDKVGARILFFLDFAEAWDYGEDKIKSVVKCICSRGHDIGVHIHPDHMCDKARLFMWEYTYEEQDEMIRKCTELYERIVGKRPLSFRAGKYSANRDTLDLLCKYGYKYDFSEFYGQKWCGIEPAITINSPVQYKSIVEFPVTMHRTLKLLGFSRFDKIDIESMVSTELRYALKQVTSQSFPVIVTLFLHSFSLMEWAENPNTPVKSEEKIRKLEEAIMSIRDNQQLEYICESDLATIKPVSEEVAINSLIVWKAKLKGIYYCYQKLKFIGRRNRKAKLLLVAVRGIFSVMVLLILFLWRINF